jgi:hypothetical protein
MDLGEVEWGGMDRIDLAQDMNQWRAPVNTIIKLRVPSWEILEWLRNWRLLKDSATQS